MDRINTFSRRESNNIEDRRHSGADALLSDLGLTSSFSGPQVPLPLPDPRRPSIQYVPGGPKFSPNQVAQNRDEQFWLDQYAEKDARGDVFRSQWRGVWDILTKGMDGAVNARRENSRHEGEFLLDSFKAARTMSYSGMPKPWQVFTK